MDLKVAYFEDILPTVAVTTISNDPKTVSIQGKSFMTAKAVYINGQPSPYFIAHNDTRITAQANSEDKVRDVVVLSSKFTATKSSLISLEISDRPEYVSGMQRLMQRFIRLLLRDPGSDSFNSSLGGGLSGMIVKYFNNKRSIVTQEVALAISRTARQLMQLQTVDTDLTSSEKIASATLVALYYSDTEGSLSAVIELISQTGTTGKMNIGL